MAFKCVNYDIEPVVYRLPAIQFTEVGRAYEVHNHHAVPV